MTASQPPAVTHPVTGVNLLPAGTAASRPKSAVVGQMYFDTANGHMMIYDGRSWNLVSTIGPWYLFIDDERNPSDVLMNVPETKIARTAGQAIELIELHGLPNQVSFDHDLGDGPSAMNVMWHLIHGHLDERWDVGTIARVQVHSMNPVGAKNLMQLWNGFCQAEGIDSFPQYLTPNVNP